MYKVVNVQIMFLRGLYFNWGLEACQRSVVMSVLVTHIDPDAAYLLVNPERFILIILCMGIKLIITVQYVVSVTG